MSEQTLILAIESSCDETSAAILRGRKVLSNIIATQKVHEKYGGVVPELASRAHQANIVPVMHQAITEAGISLHEINAIAYTRGPGLMGSLMVGSSFAKSLSLALSIPLIAVNHMQAHILAHFIEGQKHGKTPSFPLLCLTVSGGHTQLVRVDSPSEMKIVGETIDDAAGEAFDKAAKVLGLPYPGGPLVDKKAVEGDPFKYKFTVPRLKGYDYSFSGLKTSLLYFLRDQGDQELFLDSELANVCASYQRTLVDYLLQQFEKAASELKITELCIAGGVSANSELRQKFTAMCETKGWNGYIPDFAYCTDNAAMIGIAGLYRYQEGLFSTLDEKPLSRIEWG
jgi:N6-L-threonylcarbamoyladenine synthase